MDDGTENAVAGPQTETAATEPVAELDISSADDGKAKKPKKHGKLFNALKVFGFILLVLAVNAGMYFGGRPDIPGVTHTYRTYEASRVFSERRNSIDVIYVGHSGVYSGVSPMEIYDEYGIAGYNVAQMFQMPWESLNNIKDVFEEQSVKLLVLNVDHFFYDWKKIVLRSKFKNFALSAFPFYESHLWWRDGFGRAQRSYTKNYTFRTGVRACKTADDRQKTDKVYTLSDRHRECLEEIIELCKGRGVKVVLTEIPSRQLWTYDKHNCIQAYADKNGLEFWDMNFDYDDEDFTPKTDIAIDWKTDTTDGGDHLNYRGAVKLSRYLGGKLKDRFGDLLPDRREDPEYSDWNGDLKKYKTEATEKYGDFLNGK